MATPKHIVILCSRLDLPGGIERTIVNTANLFIDKGNTVTLLILDSTNTSFYPVHPSVHIIQQPLSFGITPGGNIVSRKIKLFSDVLKLRKIISGLKPHLVIATEYPFAIAAVLSGIKKQAKVISWEHHHFYELKKNNFWHRLLKLFYPKLDGVVCLNNDEKKLFLSLNKKVTVIPNFITAASAGSTTENKKILTVARLTPVKGTDLLLQAAKLVLDRHPGWTWKIIGNGEMEEAVITFIEKENLHKKLILQIPVSHDILAEYEEASVYVMTSRHECFPMTLLEAQAAGLPCIAFNCETGPRYIIHHNEDGSLIEKENIEELADAVSSLISNELLRKKMGEKAAENVQRFSPEKIYMLWEHFFTLGL